MKRILLVSIPSLLLLLPWNGWCFSTVPSGNSRRIRSSCSCIRDLKKEYPTIPAVACSKESQNAPRLILTSDYSTTTTTRRQFAAIASSTLIVSSQPQPSWSESILLSETSDIPIECLNGALVAESQVPGAYDQICMNLPVRTIPLKLPDGKTMISLQLQQGGVGAGKTGLAVWNSSLLLGRLLESLTKQNPKWLSEQQVAELGCGAGLVSLMVSKLGAKAVWATDGNPAAVDLAESNFQRNGVDYTTTIIRSTDGIINNNIVTQLPWGELQMPVEWMNQADLVLGSDLTYNSGSWRVLAESMEGLLRKDGIVLYLSLGHSGFNVRGEMDGFMSVAKQSGLSVVTSPSSLPFSLPAGVSSLDELLQSVVKPSEQSILAATGGVQVIVLKRK